MNEETDEKAEDEEKSKDDEKSKGDKKSKKSQDSKKSKDDKDDKKAKDDEEDSSESESTRAPAPHWGKKVVRVFVFASLGTFLTALLFADPIPNGLRVDFDLLASVKLGLIAGLVSAVLRAIAAMLPLFADD